MLETTNESNSFEEYSHLYNTKQYDEIIHKFHDEKTSPVANPKVLNILGATYQQLNKFDLAKEYFTKSSEIDPSSAEVFYNLANMQYSEGEYQEAFNNYNVALRNDFSSPLVLVQMGRCLVEQGAFEDAKVLYDNALEIDPNCSHAYLELAEMMSIQGEPLATVDYFYKALEIDPNSSLCLLRLSKYFNKLNSPKMALKFIQKALNLGTDSNDVFLEQADLLLKTGYPEEAMFTLKNLLNKNNQDPKVFDMMGTAMMSLGLFDEAINRFCDAIYLKPEIFGYYLNLGIALSAVGRFKDAKECLIKSTELLEGSSLAHYELGNAYYKSGDFTAALDQYTLSANLSRESILPIIGKFSLSQYFPDLNAKPLFKEICSHITEHNSAIELNAEASEDTSDTPRQIALIPFGDSRDSIYFQSLVDGHPDLFTLPGYYFKTWFEEKNWLIFAPDFTDTIWRQILTDDICRHFGPMFDASNEKSVPGISIHGNSSASQMGFDKLGKNGSEVLSINVDIFKEKLLELLLPLDQINQRTCFEIVHQAFTIAYREKPSENLTNNKILYNLDKPNLYSHLSFLSHYPGSKTLYVIQDPIKILEGLIENGYNELSGNDIQKDIQHFNGVINQITRLIRIVNDPLNKICAVGGAKLEDLVDMPNETIPRIAKWLGVSDIPELYASTFLDYQFLNMQNKKSATNPLYHKPTKKLLDSIFGDKDRKILETLFWPLMSSFKYSNINEDQFKKNLDQIRPWLDEPLNIERAFHAKIGDGTNSIETTDSFQTLHNYLVNAWEVLNKNKTYPNLIQPIMN